MLEKCLQGLYECKGILLTLRKGSTTKLYQTYFFCKHYIRQGWKVKNRQKRQRQEWNINLVKHIKNI